MLRLQTLASLFAITVPALGAEPDAAPSGVYTAEVVEGSPKMTAAGMMEGPARHRLSGIGL